MPTPLRQGNTGGWTLTLDRSGAGSGLIAVAARHAGTLGVAAGTYGGQAATHVGSSSTINDGVWDWRIDLFHVRAATFAAATDNDFVYTTPSSRAIALAEFYTEDTEVAGLSTASGSASSAAPTSGPINGVAGGRIFSAVSSDAALTKDSDGFTLLLTNFNPEEERLNVAALNTSNADEQENSYTSGGADTFVGRAVLLVNAGASTNPGIRQQCYDPNGDLYPDDTVIDYVIFADLAALKAPTKVLSGQATVAGGAGQITIDDDAIAIGTSYIIVGVDPGGNACCDTVVTGIDLAAS